MKTPLLIIISLTILCTATGNKGTKTWHQQAAVGSSVLFPEVKIDNDTFYDLYAPGQLLMMTCHGVCKIRDPYRERGHFYKDNGTLQLINLTMKDEGTYEYKMNLTMKGTIYLHVSEPVTELFLSLNEERGNGSQCGFKLTCNARNVGPLNFTFWRNGVIRHTETTENSSSWSMDGWDPATSGTFSCIVANEVSFKTSPAVELLRPETWIQKVNRPIVVGLLTQWSFSVLYLFVEWIIKRLRREGIKEYDCKNGGDQKFQKFSRVFSAMDIALGFFKEIFIIWVICTSDYVISMWFCILPALFLLIKAFACYSNAECGEFPFYIEVFFNRALNISNMIVLPAFCIATLVTISIYYRSPCGVMDIWPNDVAIVCVLLCLPYLWIKTIAMIRKPKEVEDEAAKEPLKGVVQNGDLRQPGDNSNPNCARPGSSTLVFYTNGNVRIADQCEVQTEGGSEDGMIPKPEESLLQESEEDNLQSPIRSAPSPTHEDSDGTENQERQCSVTIETEAMTHGRDRVANG